jgi:hypothetical protein
MDVERIIDDIEQLQEMFEAPDIRPLGASDIAAANRRHDEMNAHSPWFRLWQTMASVAELSLRYSDCPKSRFKRSREFRTRIGETYSRIELECFSEEIKMESTISTKDLKSKLDKKQGITVVETLAPERYREAHIPGALNIPPERIKELAPQLLPKKDAEIITYCTNTH